MAGEREILEAYIDACALVRETEEDLQRLRKQEFALGKVKGSNPEFPYQPRSFTVSGVVETVMARSFAGIFFYSIMRIGQRTKRH